MKRYPFLVSFLIVMLSGCGHPPLEDIDFTSDYTYIIGPGDGLEIFVWGNPDISRGVTVRPDGKITTPLIDDFVATGKTPLALAREIEGELAKFIRDPQVAIIVGGFRVFFSQQIRVIGYFGGGSGGGSSGSGGSQASARSFPYSIEMSLLDLLIQLGGVSEFADGNRATVIREIDGEPQQFNVRIDDLLEDGDMTANVKMFPGDIVLIPEAFF